MPDVMARGIDRQESGNENQRAGTLDKSLLVVDDNCLSCDRLALALSLRGFTARKAMSVAEALDTIKRFPPAFAVTELWLGEGSGIDVIRALSAARADARGVILTGYGTVATAVMAIRKGAFDYLVKPANDDDVVIALLAGRLDIPAEHERAMSVDQVQWEHIQRIYKDCGQNVSETARRLTMHRRTLQRLLVKGAPK